eukprot:g24128.t1
MVAGAMEPRLSMPDDSPLPPVTPPANPRGYSPLPPVTPPANLRGLVAEMAAAYEKAFNALRPLGWNSV